MWSRVKGCLVIVLMLAIILGIGVAYNQLAYGDWTCMVKRCTAVSR